MNITLLNHQPEAEASSLDSLRKSTSTGCDIKKILNEHFECISGPREDAGGGGSSSPILKIQIKKDPLL